MKRLDEYDWSDILFGSLVFFCVVLVLVILVSGASAPDTIVNYNFQPQPNSTTFIPIEKDWSPVKEKIIWTNKVGNQEIGITTNGVFFRMKFRFW